MAKAGKAKTKDDTENVATKLTARGLSTESDLDRAISEIYVNLASGDANYDQIRLLLSAIGKKLNMENLKVRAGVYRSGRPGFFLNAEQEKTQVKQLQQ